MVACLMDWDSEYQTRGFHTLLLTDFLRLLFVCCLPIIALRTPLFGLRTSPNDLLLKCLATVHVVVVCVLWGYHCQYLYNGKGIPVWMQQYSPISRLILLPGGRVLIGLALEVCAPLSILLAPRPLLADKPRWAMYKFDREVQILAAHAPLLPSVVPLGLAVVASILLSIPFLGVVFGLSAMMGGVVHLLGEMADIRTSRLCAQRDSVKFAAGSCLVIVMTLAITHFNVVWIADDGPATIRAIYKHYFSRGFWDVSWDSLSSHLLPDPRKLRCVSEGYEGVDVAVTSLKWAWPVLYAACVVYPVYISVAVPYLLKRWPFDTVMGTPEAINQMFRKGCARLHKLQRSRHSRRGSHGASEESHAAAPTAVHPPVPDSGERVHDSVLVRVHADSVVWNDETVREGLDSLCRDDTGCDDPAAVLSEQRQVQLMGSLLSPTACVWRDTPPPEKIHGAVVVQCEAIEWLSTEVPMSQLWHSCRESFAALGVSIVCEPTATDGCRFVVKVMCSRDESVLGTLQVISRRVGDLDLSDVATVCVASHQWWRPKSQSPLEPSSSLPLGAVDALVHSFEHERWVWIDCLSGQDTLQEKFAYMGELYSTFPTCILTRTSSCGRGVESYLQRGWIQQEINFGNLYLDCLASDLSARAVVEFSESTVVEVSVWLTSLFKHYIALKTFAIRRSPSNRAAIQHQLIRMAMHAPFSCQSDRQAGVFGEALVMGLFTQEEGMGVQYVQRGGVFVPSCDTLREWRAGLGCQGYRFQPHYTTRSSSGGSGGEDSSHTERTVAVLPKDYHTLTILVGSPVTPPQSDLPWHSVGEETEIVPSSRTFLTRGVVTIDVSQIREDLTRLILSHGQHVDSVLGGKFQAHFRNFVMQSNLAVSGFGDAEEGGELSIEKVLEWLELVAVIEGEGQLEELWV